VLSSAHGFFYFMIPDHPERGNWPRVEITSEGYDEGLGIGDINGDGLLDISGRYGKDGKSLAWWQNPGNGSGNWTKHPVGTTRVEMDRNVMADLNGDGRPDIVVTEESDWNGDSVYWFENPSGPVSSNWVRHKLTTQFSTNSPDVRDMNNDGSPDVIAAEHRGAKRLEIWENVGHGASWIEHVVSTGRENHLGALVADLDGDGDLDIVEIAWDGYKFLHLRLVHIATETPGATIRYTLDGSEPTTSSALYAEPLMVAGSASIKARAFKNGMSDSDVVGATFGRTPTAESR